MSKRSFFGTVAQNPIRGGIPAVSSLRGTRTKEGEKHLEPSSLGRRDPAREFRRSYELPLLLGLLGGAILAGGADSPLFYIPIVGSVSYLHHPTYFRACSIGEIVILTAAGLSAIFAVLKRFRLLCLTGAVTLTQLIATVVIFEHSASAVVAKADQPDLVDPVLMWAGSALKHARFEWGIAIVAAGAAMMLVAGAFGRWRESKA